MYAHAGLANVESGRSYIPHPELLKVRFLVKGGYMTRGKEILKGVMVNKLLVSGYKSEYYLLKAKILGTNIRCL